MYYVVAGGYLCLCSGREVRIKSLRVRGVFLVLGCGVVRGRGGGGRLRVRLGRRMTRKACTGLTVVARSDSRFVISFIHMVPKLPGTKIRSHVMLAPRRTGHLVCTLRRGITGCRHGFKPVQVPRRVGKKGGKPSKGAFVPPVDKFGKRTWKLL